MRSLRRSLAATLTTVVVTSLLTGCMLFANVPVLWFMGHRAISALRDYFRRLDAGQMRPPHAAPPLVEVIEGDDVE